MKANFKSITLIVLLFGLKPTVQAQERDTTGSKIVEKCLIEVQASIKDRSSMHTLNLPYIVSFLTRLTGIASESNGNYDGQDSPTEKDYRNWRKWYFLNKEFLGWDNEKKEVILKKSVLAPLDMR